MCRAWTYSKDFIKWFALFYLISHFTDEITVPEVGSLPSFQSSKNKTWGHFWFWAQSDLRTKQLNVSSKSFVQKQAKLWSNFFYFHTYLWCLKFLLAFTFMFIGFLQYLDYFPWNTMSFSHKEKCWRGFKIVSDGG